MFRSRLALGLLPWLAVGVACGAGPAVSPVEPAAGSDAAVIATINAKIRQSWDDNEVKASPVADDEEWLRRAYLDVVGHVPPVEEVEKFVADKDDAKRAKLVERLLDDPAYVRNWTTVWTNLAIGQQTPDKTSRLGMQRFFREAFAKNRPWNDVVHDLVAAEGHFEENGAANFLLAQMTMRDEGVLATAKTTRLLLGIQVQCTQCHNHPFNDWKQDQFWQYNAFFRQAKRVDHEKFNPQTGRMDDDYSELVNDMEGGPVFFEKRNGLMQVAYPEYNGAKVDPENGTNRRAELAKLMQADADHQLARAFVNRMWGQYFGYGFTRPVDDMGPHNAASHPELLEYLADQFVAARYDPKRLMRWIASSEPYGLTSRMSKANEFDNPAAGETPLFSHMYVKRMSAEQLYDSLIIATEAHKSGRSSWDEAEKLRQKWLGQFVTTFGTDEGDEATTFNGTIPQALMMMNGELVKNAVSTDNGSFLHDVLTNSRTPNDAVRRLYLASLGRKPNGREQNVALQLLKASKTPIAGYQDLFWALLNSNEFIFVR